MLRLVLGLVKGAILGGAIGFAALRFGFANSFVYLVYGAIGLVVGLLVGRPFWSHAADPTSTIWTPLLKGLFGFVLAIGLYSLVHKLGGDPRVTFSSFAGPVTGLVPLFGAAVGAIYGAWVELDDPPAPKSERKSED